MKHQKLVSSYTPSALQEWLEQELESRGIDCVYARSVLSLLQQDCIDVEPHECWHSRNRQLKVLYKYGGPENLYYATKAKHQKWKKMGKQILLTSTFPCCKVAYHDLERIMKKTAIDCLKSASDYVNDIEELIDEVWIKLKNKSLKGEQDEKTLRNRNPLADSFFIPPSSPTDEIEKYFAAFPPLNGKAECTVEVVQHKILKNAWCGRCIIKRKPKAQNEEALNSDNKNYHSNKTMQPIIPYKSLKTIKNIFKKAAVESTTWRATCSQNNLSKKSLTYETKLLKIPAALKNTILPFNYLSSININDTFLNKKQLLDHLKQIDNAPSSLLVFNVESNLSHKSQDAKSFIFKSTFEPNFKMIQNELVDSILAESIWSEVSNGTNPLSESSKESIYSITESDYQGIDIHFRMSPLADLLDYKSPFLETNKSHPEIQENSQTTLEYSFPEFKNVYNFNDDEFFRGTGMTSADLKRKDLLNKKHDALSYNKINYEDDIHEEQRYGRLCTVIKNANPYSLNETFTVNQIFNPLDTLETYECSNPSSSDLEQNKFVEDIPLSKFESSPSDDEIFYSDDDSNEIYISDDDDSFFLSSNTNFLPLQMGLSSDTLSEENVSSTEVKTVSISNIGMPYAYSNCNIENILDINKSPLGHNKKLGQKLLKKILNIGDVITNSTNGKVKPLSSSCEELTSLISSKHDDCDEIDCEQSIRLKYSSKFTDERNSDIFAKQSYAVEENTTNEFFSLSSQKCTEEIKQECNGICDKKWLFHWGDNHNFIARTWQKDFVPPEKIENNEPFPYDTEVITALSKEIKEEQDELLKGLCSVPGISDAGPLNELSKTKDYLHSSHLHSETGILNNHHDENISLFVHIPFSPNPVPGNMDISALTVNDDHVENEVPEMQAVGESCDYSVSFDGNPFKAANFSDLSAFSNASEDANSFKDFYTEGGGWSLASDSFTDYYCDNIYERSCSLSDLDLEKSNPGYLELFHAKRQRCISETDDVALPICNEAQNLLYKRTKQKLVPRKRPCCFYLQGSCARSDCKYSHDFSNITCRFWKDGSCFKGSTCPFLHGYAKENDKILSKSNMCLRSHSPDLSYSLESESDFPSLSSTKLEGSRVKSEAINIIEVKGLKKKRKEKL